MLRSNKLEKAVLNPDEIYPYFVNQIFSKGIVFLSSNLSTGTHIFDKEWDVCIILDTCRVDALREVADEYSFLNDIGSIWSVGGSTLEWTANTFDPRWRAELEESAYLTANAWPKRILKQELNPNTEYYNHPGLVRLRKYGSLETVTPEDIGKIEHIWTYVSADEAETPGANQHTTLFENRTPPRPVTDRGIAVGRTGEFKRMILHYIQPHCPYFANAIQEGRSLREYEASPFDYIQDGGDRQTVWKSYLDELRWVLDDVSLLLENLDAEKVAITADHGEAFGEYGLFAHETGTLHPKIQRVPWATTTATDEGNYTPNLEPESKSERSVKSQLSAMGYLD